MTTRTALVLGAGSSMDYGYPSGAKLAHDILRDGHEFLQDLITEGPSSAPREFLNAFGSSHVRSIDSFLAHRPEFLHVGTLAIAVQLLKRESLAELMAQKSGEHWYGYLLNRLLADRWDNFDPSWLTIVSFNYDRSLETFLVNALASAFGKPVDRVVEKLRLIRWHHVYGDLGSPWPGEQHLPYGRASTPRDTRPDLIRAAAERLRLIADTRHDDAHLARIEADLKACQWIAFLGFSFDPANVERIGGRRAFGTVNHSKRMVATTVGMTTAEVRRAFFSLLPKHTEESGPSEFMDMPCEQLLRETLILS